MPMPFHFFLLVGAASTVLFYLFYSNAQLKRENRRLTVELQEAQENETFQALEINRLKRKKRVQVDQQALEEVMTVMIDRYKKDA
jgi:hypothetical protein